MKRREHASNATIILFPPLEHARTADFVFAPLAESNYPLSEERYNSRTHDRTVRSAHCLLLQIGDLPTLVIYRAMLI